MATNTFKPILSSGPVPRSRLLSPLRSPEPGRALVLASDGRAELVVVQQGELVPNARYGAYRHQYTIDLTEHRLVLDKIPLLSRDANFAFRGRVGLVCRVGDPAEIVTRGITAVEGALHDHFKLRLRRISQNYDISEFHAAERALNDDLRGFAGDTAIRLRSINVELVVDDHEVVASGKAYRDIERETRLEGMKRQRHLDMLRQDGAEGLIASIVEKEGPVAALAIIRQAEADERRELLEALDKILKASSDDREPFDLVQAERTILDRVTGGSSAPFGGLRSNRGPNDPVAEIGVGPVAGRARPTREPTGADDQPPTEESAFGGAYGPPDDEPIGGDR
jgi:hypothetical protein